MDFKPEVYIDDEGAPLSITTVVDPTAKGECNASPRKKICYTNFSLAFHPRTDNVTTTYDKKKRTCPLFHKASSVTFHAESGRSTNFEFDCRLLEALNSCTRKEVAAVLKKAPANCRLRAVQKILDRLKPSDH